MYQVKTKICGVRALEEAEAAIEAGADLLGFNFWPSSPRYVEPDAAARIINRLPPLFAAIGVFVDEEPARIASIVSRLGLAAAQLHGNETVGYSAALNGIKIIKAFRVGDGFEPAAVATFGASAVLLDAGVKGSYGGTGRVFDWRLAVETKRFAPVILAGGLTVENVEEAIVQVKPLAVDVCSGVESEPGRKDLTKLREFLAVVARVNGRLAQGLRI